MSLTNFDGDVDLGHGYPVDISSGERGYWTLGNLLNLNQLYFCRSHASLQRARFNCALVAAPLCFGSFVIQVRNATLSSS